MSEKTVGNTAVAEPLDDAVVVEDQVAQDERIHEELVSNVTKMLDGNDKQETKPGDTPEEPGTPEDSVEDDEDAKKETPVLAKDLQDRVKLAGLSDDLANRLHQSGQLEETLAAFDRSMIEYIQSKEESSSKDSSKDKGRDTQSPPKDQHVTDAEVPALDPEVYDEDLVKRDAYQQQRIDALEAKIEELLESQNGGFDEWFDGTLTELGVDTSDDDKCQEVFKAYGAICDVFGKGVNDRDKAMVERAYAAMYPQDVFKQKQKQTVDRLRNAEGKFLSSPKSKGAPPPKAASDEEVYDDLVSKVSSYLKEQGAQMSGF